MPVSLNKWLNEVIGKTEGENLDKSFEPSKHEAKNIKIKSVMEKLHSAVEKSEIDQEDLKYVGEKLKILHDKKRQCNKHKFLYKIRSSFIFRKIFPLTTRRKIDKFQDTINEIVKQKKRANKNEPKHIGAEQNSESSDTDKSILTSDSRENKAIDEEIVYSYCTTSSHFDKSEISSTEESDIISGKQTYPIQDRYDLPKIEYSQLTEELSRLSSLEESFEDKSYQLKNDISRKDDTSSSSSYDSISTEKTLNELDIHLGNQGPSNASEDLDKDDLNSYESSEDLPIVDNIEIKQEAKEQRLENSVTKESLSEKIHEENSISSGSDQGTIENIPDNQTDFTSQSRINSFASSDGDIDSKSQHRAQLEENKAKARNIKEKIFRLNSKILYVNAIELSGRISKEHQNLDVMFKVIQPENIDEDFKVSVNAAYKDTNNIEISKEIIMDVAIIFKDGRTTMILSSDDNSFEFYNSDQTGEIDIQNRKNQITDQLVEVLINDLKNDSLDVQKNISINPNLYIYKGNDFSITPTFNDNQLTLAFKDINSRYEQVLGLNVEYKFDGIQLTSLINGRSIKLDSLNDLKNNSDALSEFYANIALSLNSQKIDQRLEELTEKIKEFDENASCTRSEDYHNIPFRYLGLKYEAYIHKESGKIGFEVKRDNKYLKVYSSDNPIDFFTYLDNYLKSQAEEKRLLDQLSLNTLTLINTNLPDNLSISREVSLISKRGDPKVYKIYFEVSNYQIDNTILSPFWVSCDLKIHEDRFVISRENCSDISIDDLSQIQFTHEYIEQIDLKAQNQLKKDKIKYNRKLLNRISTLGAYTSDNMALYVDKVSSRSQKNSFKLTSYYQYRTPENHLRSHKLECLAICTEDGFDFQFKDVNGIDQSFSIPRENIYDPIEKQFDLNSIKARLSTVQEGYFQAIKETTRSDLQKLLENHFLSEGFKELDDKKYTDYEADQLQGLGSGTWGVYRNDSYSENNFSMFMNTTHRTYGIEKEDFLRTQVRLEFEILNHGFYVTFRKDSNNYQNSLWFETLDDFWNFCEDPRWHSYITRRPLLNLTRCMPFNADINETDESIRKFWNDTVVPNMDRSNLNNNGEVYEGWYKLSRKDFKLLHSKYVKIDQSGQIEEIYTHVHGSEGYKGEGAFTRYKIQLTEKGFEKVRGKEKKVDPFPESPGFEPLKEYLYSDNGRNANLPFAVSRDVKIYNPNTGLSNKFLIADSYSCSLDSSKFDITEYSVEKQIQIIRMIFESINKFHKLDRLPNGKRCVHADLKPANFLCSLEALEGKDVPLHPIALADFDGMGFTDKTQEKQYIPLKSDNKYLPGPDGNIKYAICSLYQQCNIVEPINNWDYVTCGGPNAESNEDRVYTMLEGLDVHAGIQTILELYKYDIGKVPDELKDFYKEIESCHSYLVQLANNICTAQPKDKFYHIACAEIFLTCGSNKYNPLWRNYSDIPYHYTYTIQNIINILPIV